MLKYVVLSIALLFATPAAVSAAPMTDAPIQQSVAKGEGVTQDCKVRVRSHYRRGSMTKRGWRSGSSVRTHYRRR